MDKIIGEEKKREILKELFRELHKGKSLAELKERFEEVLKEVDAEDVARVEEELIKEGLPREEIQKVCDLHLALVKERLEGKEVSLSPHHPIGILLTEHRMMLEMANRLKELVGKISEENLKEMARIAHHFKDSEKHYLREENVLFPYLEKHGITEPPKVMWMEHDMIREAKKRFYKLLGERDGKGLVSVAEEIYQVLNTHFYKESNILFPVALRVISEEEFGEIKKEFAEIGYCCFTPEAEEKRAEEEEKKTHTLAFTFETGELSVEELGALLNTLPFDLTFVDKDDKVRYFNQSKERIFVRTKAVIGRKVQQCHPAKSVHIVERIIDAFKRGERDVAEFWISLQGKLVHIRYFAVRDKKGRYLGTLEVTQNITEIKKIEGERRLLDWR